MIKAIYPGNLGFSEMYQFARNAPIHEVESFTRLLKEGKYRTAVRMLEEHQEKKFHPSIYGLQLLPSHRDPRKKRWMHVIMKAE
jgi:hypothetical protein